MKCTSCGLPLSPARTMTSCPRCGTPIVSEKKSSSSPGQRPLIQTETWKPIAPQPVGAGTIAPPEGVRGPMRHPGEREGSDRRSTSVEGSYGSDPFQPARAHVHTPVTFPSTSSAVQPQSAQSTPELDPMWLPAPANQGSNGSNGQQLHIQEYGLARPESGRADEQVQGREVWGPSYPQGASVYQTPLHAERPPAAAQRRSWQPGRGVTRADQSAVGMMNRPLRRGKENRGFLVAGLCVITGGLILFFVYFMALGAPGNSSSNNALKTNHVTNSSPVSASPAASPTATPFPGQKYIDHAQLASRIDAASRQPISLTTTFKVNQSIYVTFQLHPVGQNGAVCLFWYANNRQFFTYQLPVVASEQASYAFTSDRGAGSGYVELYWASTTSCTDKMLAQRVNFTVTA